MLRSARLILPRLWAFRSGHFFLVLATAALMSGLILNETERRAQEQEISAFPYYECTQNKSHADAYGSKITKKQVVARIAFPVPNIGGYARQLGANFRGSHALPHAHCSGSIKVNVSKWRGNESWQIFGNGTFQPCLNWTKINF